jgi:hypothetical protein
MEYSNKYCREDPYLFSDSNWNNNGRVQIALVFLAVIWMFKWWIECKKENR